MLRQGGRSVVAQLPLGGMGDELAVLSGNEINIRILDAVRQRRNDDDPEALIRDFHAARKGAVA